MGIITLYGTIVINETHLGSQRKIVSFRMSIRGDVRGDPTNNTVQWTGETCISGSSDKYLDLLKGYVEFPDP